MKRENEDIRSLINQNGLMHWQVALEVGIDNTTFSKWLRIKLNDTRRRRVMDAIKVLANGKSCAAE